MLQRATSYLNLDIIRLLFKIEVNINILFLIKKRASDNKNNLVILFLSF